MTVDKTAAEAAAAAGFLRRRVASVRRPLALATLAQMANAALMILQYSLLATAIDRAVSGGADLAALWPWLGWVPPIILARAGLTWAAEAAALAAGAGVRQAVRAELTEKVFALGPVRLGTESAGALSALLVDGIEALESYYTRFLPAMRNAVLVPLALLAVVMPLDGVSGLILLLTAPLIPLFMALIGSGAERLNRRQWARLARMGAHFLEMVQGLTTLKLFNASKREAETVARIADEYRLATMAVLRVAFLSALALEFFATLGIALVAVLIGFRLLAGEIGFERGLFILLLAPEFYGPLRTLGAQYHARMEALGTAGTLADLLARTLPPLPVAAEPPPMSAPEIVFRDVHLDYGGGRIGLNGADFTLEAGRITALIGPSGAGKSSAVNLLLGFAVPSGGEILIDGRPFSVFDPSEWRRRVAWVPQRPHLFQGSIADNIRLGHPEADAAAVIAAARAVGADSFIATLPDGYDQRLGEDGGGLSGGQARLIALARAALRDAPLLILDEPSASLDAESEAALTLALPALARGRTVLVIAHRPATIAAADRVVCLHHGRVTGNEE
ncbi:thiol reductant ABC exporter subunit CydD [Magnetospirillum molischianum]|uniref:ABC transporter, CydDC cysteine exporter (CydDC-E) family, permease/ATP-binding protein CydD n=1 Tax=Magnetospirillum molischianum DSM 120 TaxID=1150626 RepID=H8FR41_MAGML|nr:thiol reductant ABC exporter subunit CydD [Magnetospirillum molischianum]CCG40829.1 ABC transporter, CydDC cysteine exporter (CydDC-E) family, permease/ATP-binding protein CydD [Magnetospirillum molischianum DSM 120]